MPTLTAAERRNLDTERARSHGFIYGVLWPAGRSGKELDWEDLDVALLHPKAVLWIHFNAANSHARHWITRCERLPEAHRAFLVDQDDRKRLETVGEGIAGVISDVHYRFDFDPDHIALLRFYLDEHCLITTRHQPLSATDDLRKAIREGLRVDSTGTLMVSLLECQADRLGSVAARLSREIGDMEDQILAERVHVPRAKLATLRRLAVRLHRHFAPEHRALQRLCGRPPAWFRDTDIGGLKDTTEALGEIVGDLDAIQERAKLLQEELAGRALEETNRNMVILSVVTAVFMPVTLITGIFGMNVAGLPGLEDGSAFWWVTLGMAGVALMALLLLHWRRLL